MRLGVTRVRRRPAVILLGQAKEPLVREIEEVIAAVGEIHPATPEPMFNLYATYVEERWIAWLFPRAAHRPACYGCGPDDYLRRN